MSDEPEMELVMPFIVCASEGGPYEDEPFAAGWELGSLDTTLSILGSSAILRRPVRTASLPQVDLIAMRRGFRLELGDEVDEWTNVSLLGSSVAPSS